MDDKAFQEESVAHNQFWMIEIVNRFNEMGVKTLEGQANFMLLDFRDKNGPSASHIVCELPHHQDSKKLCKANKSARQNHYMLKSGLYLI